MRTIFVDSEHKCHTVNDGAMSAVETDFFDGMCDDYVEGFCYEIRKTSTAIYAWKPYNELDQAQRNYEKQKLNNCLEALQELGVEA